MLKEYFSVKIHCNEFQYLLASVSYFHLFHVKIVLIMEDIHLNINLEIKKSKVSLYSPLV